jgi:hypothetical protein
MWPAMQLHRRVTRDEAVRWTLKLQLLYHYSQVFQLTIVCVITASVAVFTDSATIKSASYSLRPVQPQALIAHRSAGCLLCPLKPDPLIVHFDAHDMLVDKC